MENVLIVVAAGAAVAVGLGIAAARQGRKNRNVAASISPVVQAQGPMTLPALAEAIGMTGFVARGKVAMALNEMAAQGTVEVLPAPEGTPQLEKVNAIQYRLRPGSS